MVYNDMVYRPATLGERLQAKFGERAAAAVFKASSDEQISTGEVLSFFGRVDDTRTADRAIPTGRKAAARKTAAKTAQPQAARAARPAQSQRQAQPRAAVQRQTAPSANARTAANTRAAGARVNTRVNAQRTASPQITASFTRAYAAGEQVRQAAMNYSAQPKRRYAKGAAPSGSVPAGALKRGRSNIPGSRHAVLITHDQPKDSRSVLDVMREAFTNRHVAEHRVNRTPFPWKFVTCVFVCAVMVMAILASSSQITEYNNGIRELKSRQTELAAQAQKLEVQLEERDDIRKIEAIAVGEIGMVSGDTVQSKFVSVSASDRVEMIQNNEEESEGAISALLSVISESFGRIGEYFN